MFEKDSLDRDVNVSAYLNEPELIRYVSHKTHLWHVDDTRQSTEHSKNSNTLKTTSSSAKCCRKEYPLGRVSSLLFRFRLCCIIRWWAWHRPSNMILNWWYSDVCCSATASSRGMEINHLPYLSNKSAVHNSFRPNAFELKPGFILRTVLCRNAAKLRWFLDSSSQAGCSCFVVEKMKMKVKWT